MYAKNDNYVTYFEEKNAKDTEKLHYGRVSEAIKTGVKDGKNSYEFESWPARFVGKAREKSLALADKTSVKLTEWSARCPYDKGEKKNRPYIMVMDFEVAEKK
ncbi:hypothetical protein OBV_p-00130 (plasmid) [Oscillibacter valericigenes Sjm18-20]|nr:hypothetical protein OBV_p-00130 [Oscillibacter valericigenes Sjm18-20]